MEEAVIVKYELTIGNNYFKFDDGGAAFNVMDILAKHNQNDILIKLEPYPVDVLQVDNDKDK